MRMYGNVFSLGVFFSFQIELARQTSASPFADKSDDRSIGHPFAAFHPVGRCWRCKGLLVIIIIIISVLAAGVACRLESMLEMTT